MSVSRRKPSRAHVPRGSTCRSLSPEYADGWRLSWATVHGAQAVQTVQTAQTAQWRSGADIANIAEGADIAEGATKTSDAKRKSPGSRGNVAPASWPITSTDGAPPTAPAEQWQSRARKRGPCCTLPQAELLPIEPDADTPRACPVFPWRMRGLHVDRWPSENLTIPRARGTLDKCLICGHFLPDRSSSEGMARFDGSCVGYCALLESTDRL